MLTGFRILELSSPSTMLAGQILADLGADVIAIEPVGGAAGRRLPPFLDDAPDLEGSLTWRSLNRNKRGITLAVETVDGLSILNDLLAKADVLLYERRTISRSTHRNLNRHPRLIECEIVPFSRAGPKSNYAATELVIQASSGAMSVTGDRDRPPLSSAVPQSKFETGAEAAVACLAALASRELTGTAASVTVSARTAGLFAAFSQPILAGSQTGKRTSADRNETAALPPIWECADGFVVVSVVAGPAFGNATFALVQWLMDIELLRDAVGRKDWRQAPGGSSADGPSLSDLAELEAGLEIAVSQRTKAELELLARERGMFIAAVRDMRDISRDEAMHRRSAFAQIAPSNSEAAPIRFARISDFEITGRMPAPRLSEHTFQILRNEAGLSAQEIQALFSMAVI